MARTTRRKNQRHKWFKKYYDENGKLKDGTYLSFRKTEEEQDAIYHSDNYGNGRNKHRLNSWNKRQLRKDARAQHRDRINKAKTEADVENLQLFDYHKESDRWSYD